MTQTARHFQAVLAGCAQMFFLRGSLWGAILLAIAFLRPDTAIAGVLSVLAAYALARLIGMADAFCEFGVYVYNPLFVGLSLGSRFAFCPTTAALVVAAGALTLLLTVFLVNGPLYNLRLPVLSLPFVLVGSAAWLATAQ
jgi:urea transporter